MNKVSTDKDAIYKLMNNPRGPVIRDLRRRADNVVRYAKQIVPVDTGALKKSIHRTVLEDGHGTYIEIGSSLEYAIYVELGTRRMHARPYLRPALKAAGR